jgi:hypothetical protein
VWLFQAHCKANREISPAATSTKTSKLAAQLQAAQVSCPPCGLPYDLRLAQHFVNSVTTEVGLTFGSLGDIIAICQLSVQLGRALGLGCKAAGGSAKDYQDLRQDLDLFVQILLQVGFNHFPSFMTKQNPVTD